jgi:MIP family channel proteins
MPDRLMRALVSEAIGTFTLCFIGILAIHSAALTSPEGTVPLILIAFAHGLAIFVMVAALGANSGGHFNPAVTAGFMATGRIPLPRGAMYVAAQLVGALLASAIIEGGFADSGLVANGTPAPAETVTWAGALVMEAVATFFLVLVVFGTAVDERAPRAVFPLAIGLTVAMGIMAIGPLTGGAMNPARVFGPAVVGGQWASHWVYWVGPVLGGIAGAFVQHAFLMDRGAPTAKTATRGGPAPAEQRFGDV